MSDTPDRMPLWGPHRGGHLIGAGLIILAIGVIESLIGMPVWVAMLGMYVSTQLYYRTSLADRAGDGVPWERRRTRPPRPPEDRPDWGEPTGTPR